MAKFSLTLSVDQELHDRCVALGVDPTAAGDNVAYNALIEEVGDWSADLRTF